MDVRQTRRRRADQQPRRACPALRRHLPQAQPRQPVRERGAADGTAALRAHDLPATRALAVRLPHRSDRRPRARPSRAATQLSRDQRGVLVFCLRTRSMRCSRTTASGSCATPAFGGSAIPRLWWRPSIPPSLLAKVLLLAFRDDGLSDERAMDAVRFDLRWTRVSGFAGRSSRGFTRRVWCASGRGCCCMARSSLCSSARWRSRPSLA